MRDHESRTESGRSMATDKHQAYQMVTFPSHKASFYGASCMLIILALSGLLQAEASAWRKSAEDEDFPSYDRTALLRFLTRNHSSSQRETPYYPTTNKANNRAGLDTDIQTVYGLYNFPQQRIPKLEQNVRKRSHRIEFPCAGKNEHLSLGTAPTIATINITPGDILETLGIEASKAKQTTADILRHYAAIGIDPIMPNIHLNHLVTFSLSDPRALSGNILSIRAMLGQAYRELSRVAIILEKMSGEDNPMFSGLLEELKENGIYSLLCGLKVVMEAQHVTFSAGQIRQDTRLPPLNSRAERYARDYVVMSRIESLLNDVGSQFSTLAIYL